MKMNFAIEVDMPTRLAEVESPFASNHDAMLPSRLVAFSQAQTNVDGCMDKIERQKDGTNERQKHGENRRTDRQANKQTNKVYRYVCQSGSSSKVGWKKNMKTAAVSTQCPPKNKIAPQIDLNSGVVD